MIALALRLGALIAAAALGCGASMAAAPSAATAASAAATTAPAVNTAAAAQTAPASPSAGIDYQRARYDPIHFKPAIEKASDQQCLACHAEVLKPSVSARSPAGLAAADAKAWYQDLSTYTGPQDTFHRRHLATPLARELMSMKCTTCHQGNDPRDENRLSSATTTRAGGFDLRKMVSTKDTCLRCHGQMNYTVMGLPSPWHESKAMFQNNCLLCHAAIRTNRHQVNYLNASAIEAAGGKSGDSCYGCHGGRPWYRTTFPYPRHAWPGMPTDTPDWAKDRATASDIRFLSEVMSRQPGAAK